MLTIEDLKNVENSIVDRMDAILNEKFDKKLDEKLGVFEIMVKKEFDRVHEKIDKGFYRLEHKVYLDHEVRLENLENKPDMA